MSVAQPRERRGTGTVSAPVTRWEDTHRRVWTDTLAREEPLEIRLAGCSVAVTMRTPGDDFDLAAGFLFTEGIVRAWTEIASIAHCAEGGTDGNIVNLNPVDPALVDPARWHRNFFASSSCGICGKASIAAITQGAPSIDSSATVRADILYTLDRTLQGAQDGFARTGGLHAAGLFDLDGTLHTVREDVGRHNAVDKVIGHAVRQGQVPLRDSILMVSSRGSFELVQKALMAGIPIVATVSAPSSLAVELARSAGITLLGFLRSDRAGGGRFNVYAGAGRIAGEGERGPDD